jgi:hypothetical protein
VRWEAVTEISLRTTARGPAEEDVFFAFTYDEGAPPAIGLGASDFLLPRQQAMPGFDNEAFIRANRRNTKRLVIRSTAIETLRYAVRLMCNRSVAGSCELGSRRRPPR